MARKRAFFKPAGRSMVFYGSFQKLLLLDTGQGGFGQSVLLMRAIGVCTGTVSNNGPPRRQQGETKEEIGMKERTCKHFGLLAVVMCSILFFGPSGVLAHCDTMDGPVILDAKKALETGNVDLVLSWVQKENEPEIKKAFEKTLRVRKLSSDAAEMADMYFFETLVRVHRAGEGAPYTGVKPAGADVDPAIAEADKVLEKGSVDHLVKHMTEAVAAGIQKRFHDAAEKKKHARESVEAGREFVAAYVEFIHYVERLYQDATAGGASHDHKAAGAPKAANTPAHDHK
jgi:hypothetical protein